MTACEREHRQEPPSMRELLESCAAADAVSTPPDSAAEPEGSPAPALPSASTAALLATPEQRPDQDAA